MLFVKIMCIRNRLEYTVLMREGISKVSPVCLQFVLYEKTSETWQWDNNVPLRGVSAQVCHNPSFVKPVSALIG